MARLPLFGKLQKVKGWTREFDFPLSSAKIFGYLDCRHMTGSDLKSTKVSLLISQMRNMKQTLKDFTRVTELQHF